MASHLPHHQTTLKDRAELTGIGVHSGQPASISVLPADPGTGILFTRTDREAELIEVPALHGAVCATELCTVLGVRGEAAVATVEHVMAALYGLGIDNAVVEIDGPEVPIMDGSAAPFVAAFLQAGIRSLDAPRRYIKVLEPVRIENGAQVGEFTPHDCFALDITIDFDTPLIGRQNLRVDVSAEVFARDIGRARTFGFMADVERLWAAGYGLGASLDNTVALGEGRILNTEGLRYADEFVRHKALDAVGDLSLAGAPILGRYRSVRGGHKLNHQALCALMENRSAWTLMTMPRRHEAVQGEASAGLAAAAAFGPNVT
jgi:UDP-3-O-[3-hydroxymyristoyl] N-acetylglucosamine deacetylase